MKAKVERNISCPCWKLNTSRPSRNLTKKLYTVHVRKHFGKRRLGRPKIKCMEYMNMGGKYTSLWKWKVDTNASGSCPLIRFVTSDGEDSVSNITLLDIYACIWWTIHYYIDWGIVAEVTLTAISLLIRIIYIRNKFLYILNASATRWSVLFIANFAIRLTCDFESKGIYSRPTAPLFRILAYTKQCKTNPNRVHRYSFVWPTIQWLITVPASVANTFKPSSVLVYKNLFLNSHGKISEVIGLILWDLGF